MSKLKVGFIGGGRISDLHALGYKDNPSPSIYAVSDIRPQVAQGRAREWGAQAWYNDYRRMLADPNVDAVEIITPHHLHAPMTIEALEAGKHVSVQKPMCLNIAEADAMIAAAMRSGRLLRVMENFRFYPPYNLAKELLSSGIIGEIRSMRMKNIGGQWNSGWHVPESAWQWRADPTLCGGGPAVFDHGYHMFSIAIYFLGPVERVYAWIDEREVRPGWKSDSPAMIMWKCKDKPVYGSYEVVRAEEMPVPAKYYPGDEWVELTGSRGVLWINGCSSSFLDVPPVVVYRDGKLSSYTDLETDWGNSFVRGTHDFVDAVIDGRPSTLTGEQGREILQFALAALTSSHEGREVRPEEILSK